MIYLNNAATTVTKPEIYYSADNASEEQTKSKIAEAEKSGKSLFVKNDENKSKKICCGAPFNFCLKNRQKYDFYAAFV